MLNQINTQDIIAIAKEVGKAIMQVYKQGSSPLILTDKRPMAYCKIFVTPSF